MIPEVSALYATGDIEATRECTPDRTAFYGSFAPCAMDWQCLHSRLWLLLYEISTGLAANLLDPWFFDPAQWKHFAMEFCRQSDSRGFR